MTNIIKVNSADTLALAATSSPTGFNSPAQCRENSSEMSEADYPDVHSSTADYAKRFAGSVGEFFLSTQRELVTQLLRENQIAPEHSILEVGGGHAQLTPTFVQSGHDVTVVGSHSQCRLLLDEKLPADAFNFEVAPLDRLPFEDDSFDIVVAIRMLAHSDDWKRFVAELCRVSRRHVLVDYPDLRSANAFSSSLHGLKRRVEHNTRTFQCFSQSQVKSAFETNGYQLFDAQPQFFAPMALHRMGRVATLSRLSEGLFSALGLRKCFGSPVLLLASKKNHIT